MADELLKVRICPGCGRLKPEVNLPHRVLLFEHTTPTGSYREVVICDPCYSLLREEVAAAAGKQAVRRRNLVPATE